MKHRSPPLAEALDAFIQDGLKRHMEISAQQLVNVVTIEENNGLINLRRQIPVERVPDRVFVSSDAMMVILNHNHGALVSLDRRRHPPLWRLASCNLPLILDKSMTGHCFRLGVPCADGEQS